MNSIQNNLPAAQYLFDNSKDAESMRNDYYQYQLLPFVDDLIDTYGTKSGKFTYINITAIPLAEVIELTEDYLKARGVVSYSILNELLQDRCNEINHVQHDGMRRVIDRVNGESTYVRY